MLSNYLGEVANRQQTDKQTNKHRLKYIPLGGGTYILLYVAGYISVVSVTTRIEVSKCYAVNSKNYCFYTSGSMMNWREAKGFCRRKNATLPIITDEDTDNVFQQFIAINDLSGVMRNRSVWIGAHARLIDNSSEWQWINGQPSSL